MLGEDSEEQSCESESGGTAGNLKYRTAAGDGGDTTAALLRCCVCQRVEGHSRWPA
jgi:hypothetical protein